jgi:hypothetical protein
MKRSHKYIFGCVSIIGVITVCLISLYIFNLTPAGKAQATERALTETSKVLTETAKPTNTTKPTNTKEPTQTKKPTNTPGPTSTRRPTNTPAPTSTPAPTLTPTIPPPKSGFNVEFVSSEVPTGDYASARIRTQPGAQCNLIYILPSGRTSTASGVGKTIADQSGYCGWTWFIQQNTKPGKGTIKISAGGEAKSFRIDIK